VTPFYLACAVSLDLLHQISENPPVFISRSQILFKRRAREYAMFESRAPWFSLGLLTLGMAGCASPYYADQGALFGGAFGAGTGAVVGHALGNTGAGALVGAGVGAVSGAAVGAGMDEDAARNRALAAQPPPGAMTVPDVVAMSRNNVDEGLIINQIHARGLTAPVQAADVIYLQQQNVSRNVIMAMQSQPVAAYPPPGAVIVGSDPGYYYYMPPSVGLGVSFRSR
jgi:hypothetical protein